jgi:hypothetical protein
MLHSQTIPETLDEVKQLFCFQRLELLLIKSTSNVMLSLKEKEFRVHATNTYLRLSVNCQIERFLAQRRQMLLFSSELEKREKRGLRSRKPHHLVDACGYALPVGFVIPPRPKPHQ